MRLTIRQLEIICAVADCRSVSGAARFLRVSQPAVTRCIREVEVDYGVTLFDRTVRGVSVTPFGEVLVRRARSVTGELKSIPADFNSLRGLAAGRLAVGLSPAAPPSIIKIMARLHTEFPHLELAITEGTRGELLPALRRGDLDLIVALLFDEGPGDDLVQHVLFYNRLSVIARWQHPLARKRVITALELSGYDWIIPPADLPPRAQLDSAFHQARAPLPNSIITTGSFRVMRELLLCSDGLTIHTRENVRYDEDHKLLRALFVPLQLPLRPIGLLQRRTAVPSEPTARFIEMLTSIAEH